MRNYNKDDIVYEYYSIYNIQDRCYNVLSFIYRDVNKDTLVHDSDSGSDVLIGINLTRTNDSSLPNDYYRYIHDHRLSVDDNFECLPSTSKLALMDMHFKNPLTYFDLLGKIPNKVVSSSLNLDYGFTINEDIPYGFIYDNNDADITFHAKKYGLGNDGILDYSKLISEYTTVNGVLIVKNFFMEEYNYIALSKDVGYSAVITQDDLVKTNNSHIYFDRYPRIITISKDGKVIHDIRIDYDENGITKSFILDGKDECEYDINDDITTSIHPLVWEPFFEALYRDIITDDIPYQVEENYRDNGRNIEYCRCVTKT